jgi:hypothetical protein
MIKGHQEINSNKMALSPNPLNLHRHSGADFSGFNSRIATFQTSKPVTQPFHNNTVMCNNVSIETDKTDLNCEFSFSQ